MDVQQKLSKNFTLYELLNSDTAQRRDDLWRAQMNPPEDIVKALRYLCETALQVVRGRFDYPFQITSGYRSPELNEAVGGVQTSQHCHGQAADIVISDGFLTDPRTADMRKKIEDGFLKIAGKPMRKDVNANFYLFAHACLHLDELDVDQVIHEYGRGFGTPAWIHISASTAKSKREIVALGRYVPQDRKKPGLKTALLFGA